MSKVIFFIFYSRYAEPTFRLERSVADSTINDADLMRPYGSSSSGDPYYATLDSVGGLIADTTRQNSPKRPSLGMVILCHRCILMIIKGSII